MFEERLIEILLAYFQLNIWFTTELFNIKYFKTKCIILSLKKIFLKSFGETLNNLGTITPFSPVMT